MHELLADLTARYVQRVERFDETVASYERLGFEQVRAWSGGGDERSALFRTGPALLEVVEDGATRPRRAPAGTAASARGSSALRAG